jgi:hypothetical protein
MAKLTREQIHWLADDEFKKGLFRFRQQTTVAIMDEIGDVKGISQDKIVSLTEKICRGAVDLTLYCRGLDKEIKVK